MADDEQASGLTVASGALAIKGLAARQPIFAIDDNTAERLHEYFQDCLISAGFIVRFSLRAGAAYGVDSVFRVAVGQHTAEWFATLSTGLDVLFVVAMASMVVTDSCETIIGAAKGFVKRLV